MAILPWKVTTCSDIANALGCPQRARLIGNILKRNPNPIHVPYRRVVKSNGKLGIKFQDDDIREILIGVK